MRHSVWIAGFAAGIVSLSLLPLAAVPATAQELKCNAEKLPRVPDGCHRELIEATGPQTVRGQNHAKTLAWTAWQRTVREKYGTRFMQTDLAACAHTECLASGVGPVGGLLSSCRVKGYACSVRVDPKSLEFGDWEELGCKRVEFKTEKDVIQVGREEGRFAAIQLRVLGNAIRLLDLRVVYGNGSVDEIEVRSEIADGGQTRPLDLKGDRRVIKRIEMVYRSASQSRSRATVCVYGRT